LRSNSYPSPAETSHIREVISVAPQELATYDEELERLKEALDRLKSERDSIRSYYDVCKGILTPFRRLPSEILVEIFQLCSPAITDFTGSSGYRDGYRDGLCHVANFPLLQLAGVCSRWHTLVMGTQALWTTIRVDLASLVNWPGATLAYLKSVLARSGDLPMLTPIRHNTRQRSCYLLTPG
ncbi:hypothetical protein C8J57DRAFT_1089509, partial [Mycena rebaudengoi]